MKMKANDTLHISSVGPNTLQPGDDFDVSKHIADDLEKRGLASPIGGDEPEQEAKTEDPAVEVKAEDAPQNKAEEAPANKAVISATSRKSKKG